MKNIYLTTLIAFFCLNAFSQSKKELKSIIERKTIDSVRIHKEFSLLDSTLNEKIFELNNQIKSLTAENIKLENWCIEAGIIIIIEEEEDERELEHYEHYDTEKPIIYLYPEKIQEIEVQLNYDGKLTHTYPKYNNGWKVTANPDGTLFDAKNQEYYALYWEGKPNKDYTINEGFVVPGEQTIDFLENSLSKLGLNRKETNEFIIYWLPKMENNPYNLIHFSTTQYEEMAKLNITPTPETLIRVMMVFKPLDNPIKIKKQNLNSMSKKRKGFTVVEWGGHPLPKSYSLDL